MRAERNESQRKLLLIVLLVASTLRFFRLDSKSLWLDETVSAKIVSHDLSFVIEKSRKKDAHPPFYYALLWFWTRVFSRSEAGLRSLSALCGVGSVLLLFFFLRRLCAEKESLAITGLFALSAYHILYSQEARHYALIILLVLATNYIVLRSIEGEGGPVLWSIYALLTSASFYTFYYTIFAWVSQGLALLVCTKKRKEVLWWCMSSVVACALFSPWLMVIFERMAKLKELAPSSASITPADLLRAVTEYSTGFLYRLLHLSALPYAMLAVITLLPFVGVYLCAVSEWRKGGLVLLLFFVPIFAVLVFPVKFHKFDSKHLAFLCPLYFSSVGLCVSAKLFRRFFLSILTLLALINTISSALSLFSKGAEKERWREVCKVIERESREGDAVIANPAWVHFALEYYLAWSLPIVHSPITGRPKNLSEIAGRYRRVWLVECSSDVSVPNPTVRPALSKVFREVRKPEKRLYPGLTGRLTLVLYERRWEAHRPGSPRPDD